ncbi:MAG: hypothetical protein GX335_09735 [Firmicutes bacterium]|nr:hypothetical protein [Bacillota bacterium]
MNLLGQYDEAISYFKESFNLAGRLFGHLRDSANVDALTDRYNRRFVLEAEKNLWPPNVIKPLCP